MRSWTGPVVIGLALGIGFALATNSEDVGPSTQSAADAADTEPATAEPDTGTDQPVTSATGAEDAEQTKLDSDRASTEPPMTNRESAVAGHDPASANVRGSVARGPASGVAITFDDGPHSTHTPRVLDILARYDATAVFCIVGRMVEERPDLVRRIVTEGHVLCNHTFTHDRRLSQRPKSRIGREVNRTRDAIDDAVPGAAVPFFRQPTKFVSDEVGAVTDVLGYRRLDWTIDTKDWTEPGPDAIVRRVTERLRPGAVILLHDGGGDRTGTVHALPRILDAVADAGLGIGLPR